MPKKNLVKMGAPTKLDATDKRTLATIRGLGKIQATTREIASVLGVAHQTFITFSNNNPIIGELLEQGKNIGKMSLRRKQFKAAIEDGNTTMLIWLGKQYLEQKDKQEIASTVDIVVTDARSKLESLITRQAAAASDSDDTRTIN
jgi:hypothetical protein